MKQLGTGTRFTEDKGKLFHLLQWTMDQPAPLEDI